MKYGQYQVTTVTVNVPLITSFTTDTSIEIYEGTVPYTAIFAELLPDIGEIIT
jgi:hypothetical protein